MSKYRIKTKKEFIEEYGENWRSVCGYYTIEKRPCTIFFPEEMDNLLGMPIKDTDAECLIAVPEKYVGGRSFIINGKEESWSLHRNFITDKPLEEMKRKIIGYKLKEYMCGLEAGTEIICLGGRMFSDGYNGISWEELYAPVGVVLPLFKADHLSKSPDFFEPIYKKKKESIDIRIGAPTVDIRISRKGNYQILGFGGGGNIEELVTFIRENMSKDGRNKGPFSFTWHTEKIWIGCGKGSSISKEDIQLVIDTYNNLIAE